MGRATSKTSRGLTIIELMVVVAIVAVILSLAAPSFKRTIETQRVRGVHAQAITDIQFARSEAIRSGVFVNFRVHPRTPSATCYIIFSDTDPNLSDPPCDCRQPPGMRCPSATTAEIKTVQVPEGVVFTDIEPFPASSAAPPSQRIAFDPITGGARQHSADGAQVDPGGLAFRTRLASDSSLALRAEIPVTGRPSGCVPSGSTLQGAAC